MIQRIGETLFTLGGMMLIIGVLLIKFPRSITWFGKLPGDIMTPNIIAPFASMLVISLGLSALSMIFGALLRMLR